MDKSDKDREAQDLPAGTSEEQPGRERTSMDREPPPADDPLLRREERAAAAEAGEIGGPGAEPEGDEASRPLEEAGQGEAEGFEQSERDLVEQASHGDGGSTPETDAFPPEDDRAAPSGEPDEVDPTEVVSDPQEGPDDPGSGPGLASER
jgi:hypothetical protein